MRIELATFTGPTVIADVVLLDVSRVPECLEKMKRKHFYGNHLRAYAVRKLQDEVLYLTDLELNNFVAASLAKAQAPSERAILPKEPSGRQKSPRTIIRERRSAYFSRP